MILYMLTRGTTMLRIIICDDKPDVLEKVSTIVINEFNAISRKVKIHTFTDPFQISPTILSSCDIALLDIDFKNNGFNGVALAKNLRKYRSDTIIIFITNYIEYAPEGYEVHAFRYVLKRKLEADLPNYLRAAFSQIQTARESLKIQINGEIIDILLDNILYMEVEKHYVTIHCKNYTGKNTQKTYVVHTSLSQLEQQLENRGFLRIHKSFLVNMKYLTRFNCREAMLSNGTLLRVSEKNYANQKSKYLLWKGWQ